MMDAFVPPMSAAMKLKQPPTKYRGICEPARAVQSVTREHKTREHDPAYADKVVMQETLPVYSIAKKHDAAS